MAITTSVNMAAERSARQAADALEAFVRAAADSEAQQLLSEVSNIAGVVGGSRTTRLAYPALSFTISDIGSDGTTLTIISSGAHGLSDGDYIEIAGTLNYNGRYGPIDSFASNEIRIATVIPSTAHETVGTGTIYGLRVLDTTDFHVGLDVEVVNDTGAVHISTVSSIIGSDILALTLAVPTTWTGALKASVGKAVSITLREVQLARSGLNKGSDVLPLLAQVIRWAGRNTYHLEAYRATGNTDQQALVKAFAAVPSGGRLQLGEGSLTITSWSTIVRTTPLTLVGEGKGRTILNGPNSTFIQPKADLQISDITFSGWNKVVDLNAFTGTEINKTVALKSVRIQNGVRGISWDLATPLGSLKLLALEDIEIDTMSSQGVYVLGPMNSAYIKKFYGSNLHTAGIKLGKKLLNPTISEQNQWMNYFISDVYLNNIDGVVGADSIEGIQIFANTAILNNINVSGMVGVSTTTEMSAIYTACRWTAINNVVVKGVTKGTGSASVFTINFKGSSWGASPVTSQGYGSSIQNAKLILGGEGYGFRIQNGDLQIDTIYIEEPGQAAFYSSAEVNDNILLSNFNIRGNPAVAGTTGILLSSQGSNIQVAGANTIYGVDTAIYVIPTGGTGVIQSNWSFEGININNVKLFAVRVANTTTMNNLTFRNIRINGLTPVSGTSNAYAYSIETSGVLTGLSIEGGFVKNVTPLNGNAVGIMVNPSGSVSGRLVGVPIDNVFPSGTGTGHGVRFAGTAVASLFLDMPDITNVKTARYLYSTMPTSIRGRLEGYNPGYNPPSLSAGASTTTTITVPGARPGDIIVGVGFVETGTPVVMTALVHFTVPNQITVNDTVTVNIKNDDSVTKDLAIGTLAVKVISA